jgi:hypothetical protein
VVQRKKLGFEELGDLQHYARKQCRALYLCRQAATASKHWSVDKHRDPTVQVVVTGETAWTIYFVDEENKVPADQVFMAARDFWDQFIRENGVAKALDDRDVGEAVLARAGP